ncbi:PAAR domain-containing protein [Pendulispora brunnea]|uniref:PAAR domain-containing protein n=1 Tax=Pendulispora brunnea TaxID=2905690 RepID=A0ABZ2KKR1_9BACT
MIISAEGKTGQTVKVWKDKLAAAKAENPSWGIIDDIDPGFSKALDVIIDPPVSPTDTPLDKTKKTVDRLKSAYDLGMKIADIATQTGKWWEGYVDGIAGNAIDRLLMLNPVAQFVGGLFQLPAANVGAVFIGMPHTHQHPPSWVPPAAPVPLFSIGQIATGCPTVRIYGMPAATTDDIGYAIGCGSLSPFFKIFTGSSSVKIGGKRAARAGDLVKYCQPSSPPKPGDPPVPKNGKEAFISVVKDKFLVKSSKGDDPKLVKWRNKWTTGPTAALGAASAAYEYDKSKKAVQKARDEAKAKHEAAAKGDLGAQSEAVAADEAVESQEAAIAAQNEARVGAAETLVMDILRGSLDKLLGKDPGTPPPWGQIAVPTQLSVTIGGFPMPETAVLVGMGRGFLTKRGARWAKAARFKTAKAKIVAARGGREARTPAEKRADARAALALMKREKEAEAFAKKREELKTTSIYANESDQRKQAFDDIKAKRTKEQADKKEARDKKAAARQTDIDNTKLLIAQDKGTTPDKVSDKQAVEAIRVRNETNDPTLKPAYDRERAREAVESQAREAAEKEAKETASKRAGEAVTKTKA